MTKNYLISVDIFTRQSLPADILVLVQETPFTNLQHKEINKLLKKGIFMVITENYLTFIDTSINISIRQPPPVDILILI